MTKKCVSLYRQGLKLKAEREKISESHPLTKHSFTPQLTPPPAKYVAIKARGHDRLYQEGVKKLLDKKKAGVRTATHRIS